MVGGVRRNSSQSHQGALEGKGLLLCCFEGRGPGNAKAPEAAEHAYLVEDMPGVGSSKEGRGRSEVTGDLDSLALHQTQSQILRVIHTSRQPSWFLSLALQRGTE